MNWKRFTILTVSIFSLACITKLVIACADEGDPYEDESFFLNTINKQPAFVPFYYTPSLVFYTDGYGFDESGFDDKVADPNIAMWKDYTNNEVSTADLDSFIYTFSRHDVTNLYENVAKGSSLNVPEKVSANGFAQWSTKHKDVEALRYLVFAKSCEPHTVPLESSWDDKTNDYVLPARDTTTMAGLVNEGLKLLNEAKSTEIKQRYAYQVLRMAFYAKQYRETISLYDKLVAGQKDNFLFYRCLGLKAGALYKLKQKTEAAYLYSLVFDKCDDNKKTIYTSFRWAVNGEIQPVLDQCKNDHERAVVYIMKGLYDYSGSDDDITLPIRKAYELDPKVNGLDIVMTRRINKLESDHMKDIATANLKADPQLAALDAFAQKAAAEGKAGTLAYWQLCSAYIAILDGNAARCGEYLAKAATQKMTANEQDVYAIVNVLYTIRKHGRITEQTEQELLPVLKAVAARGNTESRYRVLFSGMMVAVLKAAYLAQGDVEKAIYCHSKVGGIPSADYTEDYTSEPGSLLEKMSPQKLRDVEAFVTKKNKSLFEAWLTENTSYTPGALQELEGTKYLRMFDFDSAVGVLSKVPDSLLRRCKLPDIMVSHILDNQEWNKSDKGVSYNKLEFARKMLELQQKLKSDPKDGRAAYQFANGLYSMSYYGKGHHAYDYYRSGTDEYAYFDFKSRAALDGYALEHYTLHIPEMYYQQAFNNSEDREVKARCLFMAAKCWQKNCPSKNAERSYFDPDLNAYYFNTFKNPHLIKLKSEYKDTKFYTTAVKTCSYFKDFVAK